MKQIFTIHDRFIRSILNEDLQITAELLRSYLPSDLASYVKWDTIEPVNTAQIGPNRNMLYPDLVFRVIGESDGQQIVVYFIIEHKSYPSASMRSGLAFRLPSTHHCLHLFQKLVISLLSLNRQYICRSL